MEYNRYDDQEELEFLADESEDISPYEESTEYMPEEEMSNQPFDLSVLDDPELDEEELPEEEEYPEEIPEEEYTGEIPDAEYIPEPTAFRDQEFRDAFGDGAEFDEIMNAPAVEEPVPTHKRPTRNYVSYGLGMAMWHNYDFENDDYEVEMSWEQAFVFHYGRIFEVVPHAAITIINNMNISFGSDWEWHETFLIGGRYFVSTGNITPYIGLGGGLGIQTDEHYEAAAEGFAIGLATGAELGIIFFRNSATQLELGLAWDALWDGFESFDRRFGSGSFYVAINY